MRHVILLQFENPCLWTSALTSPENLFFLSHAVFWKNLRCAKRGAVGGLTGMIAEHLRPLLGFWGMCQEFAQGTVLVRFCRQSAWAGRPRRQVHRGGRFCHRSSFPHDCPTVGTCHGTSHYTVPTCIDGKGQGVSAWATCCKWRPIPTFTKREGERTGDALTALFCLGQHSALVAVQEFVGERTAVRVPGRHLRHLPGRVVPNFQCASS